MGDLDKHTATILPCRSKGKRRPVLKRVRKQESDFNPKSFAKLSDKKLEKMSIKELNDYTRLLPKHQAQELKKRRRILKNRKYALKCRLKSITRRQNMAEENQSLEKELSATRGKLKTILDERDYYKSKCVHLCSRVSAGVFAEHRKQSGLLAGAPPKWNSDGFLYYEYALNCCKLITSWQKSQMHRWWMISGIWRSWWCLVPFQCPSPVRRQ